MNFFQNANGLWEVGRNIIPAGNCSLRVDSGDQLEIVITSSNRKIFSGELSSLKKQDGESYVDLQEFILLNKLFFLNSAGYNIEEVIGDLGMIIDNINGEVI